MKRAARKTDTVRDPREGWALRWVADALADEPGFGCRRQFGGLSVFVRGATVAVLTESPDDHTWQGREYPYAIWDGVLVPTSREHHASLQRFLPSAVAHPVLGKWLYLPRTAETFETDVERVLRAIRAADERVGVPSAAAARFV